ncbi:hypothetical protein D3C76_1792030 [compost metagenome]
MHAAFCLLQNIRKNLRIFHREQCGCTDGAGADRCPVVPGSLPVIRSLLQKRPEQPLFRFLPDPQPELQRKPFSKQQ